MLKAEWVERHSDSISGGGRCTCVGKPVTTTEFNKMYVGLLRQSEFMGMNMLKRWTSTYFGAHFQKHMWVALR